MKNISIFAIILTGFTTLSYADVKAEQLIVSYRQMTGQVDKVRDYQKAMCESVSQVSQLYPVNLNCVPFMPVSGIHLYVLETGPARSQIMLFDYKTGVRIVKEVWASQLSVVQMDQRLNLLSRILYYYMEARDNAESLKTLQEKISKSNITPENPPKYVADQEVEKKVKEEVKEEEMTLGL